MTTAPPGNHVVFVAAPGGRMVPMALEAGQRLLGFKAVHLWPVAGE